MKDAESLLTSMAQESLLAAEQRDLVELTAVLGGWQIASDLPCRSLQKAKVG